MRKTTLLKKLINEPEVLVMPGVYDCITARLAQKAGFKALQVTGFGVAASLGVPDIGLMTATEVIKQTAYIVKSVDVPVMADGDNGFGNAVNTFHTVQEVERTGAAGINLEDQVFPKRCGHMTGKQIISLEEMVGKIKAAVKARQDQDFVINARTDAVVVSGVEEAIKRGNAYLEAGADIIFVESPRTVEEIQQVINGINGPVSINMLDDGLTPLLTVKELGRMGVARVSFPLTGLFASTKALEEIFTILFREGTVREHKDKLVGFPEMQELLGLSYYRQLEREFLTSGEINFRYGSVENLEKSQKINR